MIPFHMAFAVKDKETTRHFYGEIIGCKVGREAENWIDFDFFGHQLSAHINNDPKPQAKSKVGNDMVPLHHFGAVLPWDVWNGLIERLRNASYAFVMEPKIRFENEPGEQGTFFLLDPSGNALEFKSFRNPDAIFEH
ncbi:VOC family protein [Devosia submarina]|uniref:VOC family protein n=1 Tax=Devosia submarina TaxID=1173082 RepID=UPI000D3D83DA|nr:VOC family protein [Devosia submarina]